MPYTDELNKEQERLNREDMEREQRCGLPTIALVALSIILTIACLFAMALAFGVIKL